MGQRSEVTSNLWSPISPTNNSKTQVCHIHFYSSSLPTHSIWVFPYTAHFASQRSHKISTPVHLPHACADETADKLYFMIAVTTASICSAVSSGYIGNETIRSAVYT